ncbi:MAG: hypothetical protein ABR559_01845 [Gemmatimonadota bacterium]
MGLGAVGTMACASGGGSVGAVRAASPIEVHGDDRAIAWPFTVTHGGGSETFADFHLRIEDGGTLVGVRPNAENPDPEAQHEWRGSLRQGAGYWIGDVLPRGASVTLTLLVRPTPGADPRLRVVHWPTNGVDVAVGPETCEVWSFDPGDKRVRQEPC